MSTQITIEGKRPLQGSVELPGSAGSAVNLISASLLCNEDVVLENVPQVGLVTHFLSILGEFGVKFTWLTSTRLVVNASGFEYKPVLQDPRTTVLLLPAILYRFSRARVATEFAEFLVANDDLAEIFKAFGVSFRQDGETLKAECAISKESLNIKSPGYLGSVLTVLLTLLVDKKQVELAGYYQDPELDDLLSMVGKFGCDIDFDGNVVTVVGKPPYSAITHTVVSDQNLAVFYALAAITTGGSLVVKKALREYLTAFSSLLSKAGAGFEFTESELHVWSNGDQLKPVSISVGSPPLLINDWLQLLLTFLVCIPGESHIETASIPANYIKDLNMVGADVEVVPGGINVHGRNKLKSKKLHIDSVISSLGYVLIGLIAEGKTQIVNTNFLSAYYIDILNDLRDLDAKIN